MGPLMPGLPRLSVPFPLSTSPAESGGGQGRASQRRGLSVLLPQRRGRPFPPPPSPESVKQSADLGGRPRGQGLLTREGGLAGRVTRPVNSFAHWLGARKSPWTPEEAFPLPGPELHRSFSRI